MNQKYKTIEDRLHSPEWDQYIASAVLKKRRVKQRMHTRQIALFSLVFLLSSSVFFMKIVVEPSHYSSDIVELMMPQTESLFSVMDLENFMIDFY